MTGKGSTALASLWLASYEPEHALWGCELAMSKSEAVGDGKVKTRQLAKQETREALLRAGMSLFSEEGVDLPSLEAICERAGFTRGAFYVHFRNRDDFMSAVIDRVLVDFIDSMLAAAGTGDDLMEIIGRFVKAASQGQVPLMGQQRRMIELLTRGGPRTDKLRAGAKVLLQGALERLSSAAASGQASGKVRSSVAPELIATWLLAAALGLTTLLDLDVRVDGTRLADSARDLLRIEPA